MIFPATDNDMKELSGKEIYYGYYMDPPDDNLLVVLNDRPISSLCDVPKIYTVDVTVETSKIGNKFDGLKLKLKNNLGVDDDPIYTDYPLYKKDGMWFSSYESLILGYSYEAVYKHLLERLFKAINFCIVNSDYYRFSWYMYCLGILSPDDVEFFKGEYPEFFI